MKRICRIGPDLKCPDVLIGSAGVGCRQLGSCLVGRRPKGERKKSPSDALMPPNFKCVRGGMENLLKEKSPKRVPTALDNKIAYSELMSTDRKSN